MKNYLRWIVLVTALIASSRAQATGLIWTNQSGTFSDANNWSPVQAPGGPDGTRFTNDTSYTVAFTASTAQMVTNDFNGHAGTVTLDIGAANGWTLTNQTVAAGNAAFVVGQTANTTATVLMVSGSLNVTGISGAADMKIGGNGQGTFTVTNGTVRNNTTILGDTATGRGTLTIAGPSTPSALFAQ